MLYCAHLFPTQQELWAPPCCGMQSQGLDEKEQKALLIKCRCVCTQGPAGAVTRLQSRPCLGYRWGWPCADHCIKPGYLALCLISADCAGCRERQRGPPQALQALGLTGDSLPSRGLALCPGQSHGEGQRGETAIASNPEQKTGVSTVVAPDDRSGVQGLQAGPHGANPWWRMPGAVSPTRLTRPVCGRQLCGSSTLEGKSLHGSLRAIQQGGRRCP